MGTTQFGLNYGISNKKGQTSIDEVREILKIADENGINVLDTAALYGDSEKVLGQTLQEHHRFRIITKTPQFKKELIQKSDIQHLKQTFVESLRKLNQPKLAGLLIHYAEDLLVSRGEELFRTMESLKLNGLVDKIGVSIYRGEQIDKILEKYNIDIVQLPINVLDQRFLRSGHLSKLKGKGIEIHARSAFLQGLLLMPLEQIHPYFASIMPLLTNYHRFLREQGLSLIQGALCFLNQQAQIDIILVGVNDKEQLERNIKNFKVISKFDFEFSIFAIDQENIVNPSLWKIS